MPQGLSATFSQKSMMKGKKVQTQVQTSEMTNYLSGTRQSKARKKIDSSIFPRNLIGFWTVTCHTRRKGLRWPYTTLRRAPRHKTLRRPRWDSSTTVIFPDDLNKRKQKEEDEEKIIVRSWGLLWRPQVIFPTLESVWASEERAFSRSLCLSHFLLLRLSVIIV